MARSNWGTSNRRQELPADWHEIRARVRKRAGGRCEHVSTSGYRCKARGTDADHALDRSMHDDWAIQWLCPTHHKRKTAMESREAKVAKRRKGARARRDDRPGAL